MFFRAQLFPWCAPARWMRDGSRRSVSRARSARTVQVGGALDGLGAHGRVVVYRISGYSTHTVKGVRCARLIERVGLVWLVAVGVGRRVVMVGWGSGGALSSDVPHHVWRGGTEIRIIWMRRRVSE